MSVLRARGSLVVVVLAGIVVASPSAQQTVFRGGVDSVALDVSVTSGGRSVSDLVASDFEIRDKGVAQTIVDLSRESVPIDVTLIVDVSGSVQGPLLQSLMRAIDGVGRRLRDDDGAKVISFNHRITERVPSRSGGTLNLMSALRPPAGQTSLLDAMAVSLIAEPRVNRRQMAIVFTDGQDTVSLVDEATVLDIARRSEAAVFVVAVTVGTVRSPTLASHMPLFSAITDATGGRVVMLQRDEDLSESFVHAFDEFRTSYVLRYIVRGVERPGWHDVTVKVTRPGRYELRARKGYFG